MTLHQFLAKIAVNQELYNEFVRDRDVLMNGMELSEADQAALRSGSADEVISRLTEEDEAGRSGVATHTVSHVPPLAGHGIVSHVVSPWTGNAVTHTVSHVVAPGLSGGKGGPGSPPPGAIPVCAPVVTLTIWPAYMYAPPMQNGANEAAKSGPVSHVVQQHESSTPPASPQRSGPTH